MRWEGRSLPKQTTGKRDVGFIDQWVELKVKSDIQCAFLALMLGKAFLQVTWIFIHLSINEPPHPPNPYPTSSVSQPSHSLIWVYVLNRTSVFNKFTALWRGSYPHFSSAWPSDNASFYPPLTHTYAHILSMPANTRTHTNTCPNCICLSHIHTMYDKQPSE